MSSETQWLKVSKTRPCPICDKPDWCRIAPDGKTAWCGRVSDGGTPAKHGWIHRLPDDLPPPAMPARRNPKPARDGGPAYATADQLIERLRKRLRATSHQSWPYLLADGSEVFRVVRLQTPEGKKYRPIRPAADGWRTGDPPEPLPLYRLPDLQRPGTVFVPEGEKCADACRGIGLIATTSAHGAQAAEKSNWQPLAGRDVVILPDNDKPGRDYANAVARLLMQSNPPAIVRIVELPGLAEGEDIADWLNRLDGKEPAELAAAVVELASRVAAVDAAQLIGGPKLTRLSDVEPQSVEWLWNQRIAIGKLTLLCGDPGLGKSFITLDMAARVSRGASWPDAADLGNVPGSVILLSAEDDLADTIRPRLDKAGADAERIVALEAVSRIGQGGKVAERAFTLADLPALERALAQTPGVRLVIIDPISAYLPADSDSHNNAEIRQVLTPLSKLAAQYRVAILMVTHLNKSSGSRAMYRATGSLAFAAAARSAWLVTKDPNDARRRLVLPIKNNLGNDSTGLAYSIIDGAVAWEPNPIEMTADEALAQEAARSDGESSKQSAAAEWLAELLRDGPLPVAEAERQAIEAGFSKATLRRAREALKIRTMKSGFEGGWRLALPEGAQPPPAKRTGAADVSAFGNGEHLRIVGTENGGRFGLPDTPLGEDAQRLAGSIFDTRKAG